MEEIYMSGEYGEPALYKYGFLAKRTALRFRLVIFSNLRL